MVECLPEKTFEGRSLAGMLHNVVDFFQQILCGDLLDLGQANPKDILKFAVYLLD
jgi:hypothetical protein